MSDGRKRMYEDIEEWSDFCTKVLLPIPYDMYSEEAKIAKEGNKTYNLTGRLLADYINLKMQLLALVKEQAALDEEYKEYLRLKEKFEKRV